MVDIIVGVGRLFMNAIYAAFKLCVTPKKKVLFLSRQADYPSLDMCLLSDELKKQGYDTVVLCRQIGSGLKRKISYCFHIIAQMYYMASSSVVVLDGYCIAVSLLRHRKSLRIIQMWHALGAMKKFGYSVINSGEGSSDKIAKAMRMHFNYDYILASGHKCVDSFAEAFGYEVDKMVVLSLPRVDALMDKEYDTSAFLKITDRYPEINNKKTILYAPTFRKNSDMTAAVSALIDAIDLNNYNLVIKMHPLAECAFTDCNSVIFDKEFTTLDMLSVSDYVITDYSAITYEAAIKDKPLFFYVYDIDDYSRDRDFYLNYREEMPGVLSSNAVEIFNAIQNGVFYPDKVKRFADAYIDNKTDCTQKLVDFISGLVN